MTPSERIRQIAAEYPMGIAAATLVYLDEQAAAHPVAKAMESAFAPTDADRRAQLRQFAADMDPGTPDMSWMPPEEVGDFDEAAYPAPASPPSESASIGANWTLTGTFAEDPPLATMPQDYDQPTLSFSEMLAQKCFDLRETQTLLLAATNQRDEARAELTRVKRELTKAQENNHKRNIELDAVGYVWCSGTCKGTRRFTEGEITAEHVAAAMRNTERMLSSFVNRAGAAGEDKSMAAYAERWESAKASVSFALLLPPEAELTRLKEENARLQSELTWERGWDLYRKAQMGALVEAAREAVAYCKANDYSQPDTQPLEIVLSALDQPSQLEAPSERAIVVGSTWRHKRSGSVRKVTEVGAWMVWLENASSWHIEEFRAGNEWVSDPATSPEASKLLDGVGSGS